MAETSKRTEVPEDSAVPDPVEPAPEPQLPSFPIVGVGASAGGMQAFEAFFAGLPPNTKPGMAFVLVQHLSRDHKSILSELLRRHTTMEIFEVEDGMVVQPNCVYIIPPNRDMALTNGALHLLEPTLARGIRLPIDFFFRSLAQEQRDRAICIVLSGTGSDGTLGLRAVKGEGGMAMVQTPETTEHDGMPRSAIATGMVDFVLPADQMITQLLAFAARAFTPSLAPLSDQVPSPADGLERIFLLLRSQTGHDFSQYKRNTILRRIARRMAVHQIDKMEDYLRYLQLTPDEIEALFRDLLIGVTNFFRDAEIFEEIQKQVIPLLLAGKTAESVIRIWVPGCSTGEEAYSLAILLRERMEETKQNLKVQVFATDIDREAIDQARAGIYPASIIADVSPERLAHFFTPEDTEGNRYRIQKKIRDMLIFSEHDLIKDPPFSRLDLISCRNLLIYMGHELQKRLMPMFHYALNPDGVLVLGSSESVGEFAKLFSTLDRGAKIFQRKPGDSSPHRIAMATSATTPAAIETERQTSIGPRGDARLPLHDVVVRTLMAHYSPVGALVSEHGDILYLLGRTGRYLEPTPGEASLNIFRMARPGLRGDLTIALHRAVSQGVSTRSPGLRINGDERSITVDLTVVPVSANPEGTIPRGLFLVLLDEKPVAETPRLSRGPAVDAAGSPEALGPNLDTYILRLKEELREKDEYLQNTIEELETSNEELRSAHEEMQSVNEEMQSTNEELETSKEELQSVNEELATVNSELQTKVQDLSRSNNDMVNLLSGTGIATIFVDCQLCILRFTPTIAALIHLIETDVGRPVDQIRSKLLGYDGLAADVKGVLDSLIPRELEVQTTSGEWYLLRIRPYRTLENVIDGAVITFTEISTLKTAQLALRDSEALRRLAVVVRDSRDAILVQDLTGRILAWNLGAEKMYGWTEAEALAMNIRSLIADADREQVLLAIRRQSEAGSLEPMRLQRVGKDGKTIKVSLIVSSLVDNEGKTYAIATTERRVAG